MNTSSVPPTIRAVKIIARIALGLVWLYEGLVPKILYIGAHPEQAEIVRRSGLYWPTPESTLSALGVVQVLAGLVLIAGRAERFMVVATTGAMFVLIVLVAHGKPDMLTDPFGALMKDVCLVSCALTVWFLAPLEHATKH